MTMPAPKSSIWRETLKEIIASRGTWQNWVLGFVVIFAAANFLQFKLQGPPNELLVKMQSNPLYLSQHPEYQAQYLSAVMANLKPLLLFFPIVLLLQAGGYYTLVTKYLQYAVKKNPPSYTLDGFFYWLGRGLWKYIRPVLWNLIPIIGPFFYLRSLIRYTAVSPLAALKRAPELQRSWDLTKGNWWRIFGNYFLLILILAVPSILIMVLVGGWGYFMHRDLTPSIGVQVISTLLVGIWSAFAILLGSVFSCTVYRVLLQEQRKTSPTDTASTSEA